MTEIIWPWPDGARYELHLYYDGVRRIQEVCRLVLTAPSPMTTTWTEYIYGAGYVDEFVLAANPTCPAQYIHQDANYDVVAQTDIEGNVVCQSTWSPFGELLASEAFDAPAGAGRVAIGHQGLFYNSLNVISESAVVLTGEQGGYYCRNRLYSALLGRFTQRDPNGWGAVPVIHSALPGEPWSIRNAAVSPSEQYLDGMSLYLYENANPLIHTDSLGLSIGFSLVLGQAYGGGLRNADAEVSGRTGGFIIALQLRYFGLAVQLTSAGLTLWGSWELARVTA